MNPSVTMIAPKAGHLAAAVVIVAIRAPEGV
jgi:hypothetical protein